MKAQTQAMRAKVVEAEALVPAAQAEAFRAGHLGIMDFYRMQNVLSDTDMRSAISQQSGGGQTPATPPSTPPASS